MFPESWNGQWRNTVMVVFGSICSLALIPVFMSQLSLQHFGIWLVFSNLTTLMLLLLLGLDNTLPRLLSYILAGAKVVHANKISTNDLFAEEVNLNLLHDFIKQSKKLIVILSGTQAVVALLVLPYLLTSAGKYNQVKVIEISVTWIFYGIGICFLFSFHLFNSILRGFNEIYLSNLLVAIQRLMFLTFSTLILLGHKSLYSVSIAFLLSNFSVFYYSKKVVDSKLHALNCEDRRHNPVTSLSISKILKNTRLLAINSISGFLILRFSMLASVLVLNVETATQYNLTVTLFLSLYGICLEVARNYTTILNTSQAKKNVDQLLLIYRRMRLNTLLIFTAGASILILLGNTIVMHISSDLSLVAKAPLMAIFLIYLLELNHTVSAIYLSSHNYFPMTGPVILSGALIALTGMFASTVFSIWGFIFSQGLIQLLYNNWKWPYVVRQEFKLYRQNHK